MNMTGADAGRPDAVPAWAMGRAAAQGARGGAWPSPMGAGLFCGAALVTTLAVAGLVLPLTSRAPPPPVPPAAAGTVPAWVDIVRPVQFYALPGSSYTRLPLAYGARRRTTGDVRQDTLTFGTFDGAAPYLNLTLTRQGADAPPAGTDLVVDLARIAAGDGVALMRAGLPASLPTRFGDVLVASVTLQRADRSQPCLGFRLQGDGAQAPLLDIRGLACGADPQPLQPEDLACVLDRIDLMTAGDDTALRDTFVAAARRKTPGCSRDGNS